MADEKKSTKSQKFTDVSHPGRTAPSPNSRSVILAHRPIMRDPMMSPDLPDISKTEPKTATTINVSRASGGVVQPLTNSTLVTSTDIPKDVSEPKPATIDEPEPIPEADSAPTPAKVTRLDEEAARPSSDKASSDNNTRSSSEANIGTKDVQSDAELAAAEEAEAARQAKIAELIETKKYYLPINTLEKQRTKQFVAGGVLLSVVLVAVWADIALDAGLIKIGHVKALTHFFK